MAEKNEEMQNSTSKEIWRINCTSKIKKERYLRSFDKNLDELLKNELNQEEPSWNSDKQKNDEIKLKDERIRLKPCDDLDGGSDEMTEEIELRKRKDENTWN